MSKNSYFSGGNIAYLEQLYDDYLTNPSAIPGEWREIFESLPSSNGSADVSHTVVRDTMLTLCKNRYVQVLAQPTDLQHERKQANVINLIHAYRCHGHQHAQLDPLGGARPQLSDLSLAHHGLSHHDLHEEFNASGFLALETKEVSLEKIFLTLNQIYCGSVGMEYMHITDPEQIQWLQRRIEVNHISTSFSIEEKQNILKYLTAA